MIADSSKECDSDSSKEQLEHLSLSDPEVGSVEVEERTSLLKRKRKYIKYGTMRENQYRRMRGEPYKGMKKNNSEVTIVDRRRPPRVAQARR